MQRFVFDNAALQAGALAERVGQDLARQLDARGEAVLAVSGGRSPLPFFERLSQADLDWSRVTVTLVDERVVAQDHPDSNARLVREALLVNRAAAARFHPMVRDGESAEEAASARLAEFRQPQLVVLGMGEDGHTASLFPDAPELTLGLSPDAPAVIAVTPGSAPHRRVSLTLPALCAASRLYLSIQGEAKRAVLDKALAGADPALPVSVLLARPGLPLDSYEA
ncbi:6-phosphogluconolactonase [Paludibacterium paludis]|uniref:6-phosphogluconolactonase n=1 Tax=Paludibacterium paludis TaxID=1225769 RepID=A0A918NZM3_9NEIS|nr:6-phosphogluconolactonase [Paludibacterium paludis]GGY09075.1 6-phosphogluconolactonase [Paludibacterium paludis]